jgi:hypothetical protein
MGQNKVIKEQIYDNYQKNFEKEKWWNKNSATAYIKTYSKDALVQTVLA